MHEAHQNQTLEDYTHSIKEGPESAWPVLRLPEQVTKAVEHAEKLVNLYNRDLAAGPEPLETAIDGSDAQGSETRRTIDLSNLPGISQGIIQGVATVQAAYLADMAKAKALDQMGVTEKAVALVDRHI